MSFTSMLRQLQVSTRLGLLALVSLLAVTVSSAVGLWAANRLTALSGEVIQTKDIVADVLPPPLYLIEARLVVSQALEGMLAPADAERELQRLASEHDARQRYWTTHPIEGMDAQLLARQYEAAHAFMAAAQALVEKAGRGEGRPPSAQVQAMHELYVAHRAAVDQTVQVASALAEHSIQGLGDVIGTSQYLLWVTLGVTTLCTALLFLLVVRSILQPLRQSISTVQRVANGDLSHEVPVQGRDELAQLQAALQHMQVSLTDIVHAVRANADGVATASTQISAGNNDLCHRTEQQASALQQTAATMEQLGVTVRSNADHAREASQLALGASQVAEAGGQLMGQVVQTMGGIFESSRRIGEIVGVINDIAFQTNILALNAAVEAARAGEQGRGFAVVAAEVRTLAQRTAQSARQIKDLIGTSTTRVDDGSRLVDEAGQTMERIVAAIRRVNAQVLHISSASGEQSEGVSQVGAVVNQLDENTQRNAALVEQSAAAAESLRAQAAQLVQMVQRFRLAA